MASVGASAYYSFARTKGLNERQVLLRHGVRNAGVPVVAYLGVQMVLLVEGVIVVETLFAWPGIGSFAIESLTASDYAPVQGFVLTMGLLYVLLNLAIDLAYLLIDPRVALEA